MKLKRLGRTGLQVTEICLGTMTFGYQCDEKMSFEILDNALNAGITFIDTADVYPLPVSIETAGATESILGNWFAKNPGRRHDTVLATKCNGKMGNAPHDQGLSRRHIMDAIEASLRRLKTDFIDLYQVHFYDPNTPLDETLRALDDIVHSGKARYIGCSNYLATQLAKALWTSDKYNLTRYDCIQPRYNLLFREFEKELFPFCLSEGVGVICYNPLAGGMLTGKHKQDTESDGRFTLGNAGPLYKARYWHEAQFAAVEKMKAFFGPRNKSIMHVALAWVLHQPAITSAIVGASKPGQIVESVKGINLTLEPDELAFLDELWYDIPKAKDPSVTLR